LRQGPIRAATDAEIVSAPADAMAAIMPLATGVASRIGPVRPAPIDGSFNANVAKMLTNLKGS
jgi:hypothetical protein